MAEGSPALLVQFAEFRILVARAELGHCEPMMPRNNNFSQYYWTKQSKAVKESRSPTQQTRRGPSPECTVKSARASTSLQSTRWTIRGDLYAGYLANDEAKNGILLKTRTCTRALRTPNVTPDRQRGIAFLGQIIYSSFAGRPTKIVLIN